MKRAVIALIVLVVLLVAADFAAASAAEYQVSSRLRTQLALPADPDVRVTGFPFVAQALAGDYRKVAVSAEKLSVGELRNVGVRAELYHVRVPAREVLSGSVRTITVDEAQGSVLITREDLVRLLPGVSRLRIEPVTPSTLDQAKQDSADAAPGSSVSGIDPNNAVRMIATISLFGRELNVSVIAVLALAGRQVQISPRDIRVGSGADATRLPRAVQGRLRQLFTVRVDPGGLPFAVTPTTLKAVDNALEVSGTARDVVISGRSSVKGE